jgi:hypothetical protein
MRSLATDSPRYYYSKSKQVRIAGKDHAGQFHTALNGMVESQMKKAVQQQFLVYGLGKCRKT